MLLSKLFLQVSSSGITDKELTRLAQCISISDMQTIATGWLGLTFPEIENIEWDERKSLNINMKILRRWRNTPGNDRHVGNTFHWQIQGAPLVLPPILDPILSISHTFLPKSTRVTGWHPPPQRKILDQPLL